MLTPQRYSSGRTVTMKTVSETTITKNNALDFSNGYVQRATNATTEVRFVALEDKTTAAAEHEDILCLLTDGVQFIGDTNSTMAQSKVGTYIDLTDHDTLDENTAQDNVFYVTEMVGATTNNKCKGFFVMKND